VSHDRSTVEAVVKNYFDGLYEGNADKLAAVFHPSADLRWLERARCKFSPCPTGSIASGNVPPRPRASRARIYRHHRPLRQSTAFIKVRCQLPPLFHRLSGGDETQRRMADRLQIVPLRLGE
jgi:hypothetical protein